MMGKISCLKNVSNIDGENNFLTAFLCSTLQQCKQTTRLKWTCIPTIEKKKNGLVASRPLRNLKEEGTQASCVQTIEKRKMDWCIHTIEKNGLVAIDNHLPTTTSRYFFVEQF